MGEKGNLDPVALQKLRAYSYGYKSMKGGAWVNQSGWMLSQRMKGSPLRPDRRKPTYFYLFSFSCTREARACVRVPSNFPWYT